MSDAFRALMLLDLTSLGEADTEADIDKLCADAGIVPPVAAVCVWPRFVARACDALRYRDVRVATVVNFPAGESAVATVTAEIRGVLAAGADEIDLVLPWRAFLAGDTESARDMVKAARQACGVATLKVILETGEHPDLMTVRAASDLAIAAGADFIKTSTGKTARSASPEAARVMLEAIKAAGRPVGLKPSGGIRSLADATVYLALADTIMGPLWADRATFRFGASSLHATLLATVVREIKANVEAANASHEAARRAAVKAEKVAAKAAAKAVNKR